MTEAALRKTLDRWTARLGLDRWDITLNLDEPAQDDAHASTWRSNTYETAVIRVAHPDWKKWTDEEGEKHVVHELIHLLTRDLEEVLKIADEQLPPAVDKAVETAFWFRTEQLVDLLARRFIAVAND